MDILAYAVTAVLAGVVLIAGGFAVLVALWRRKYRDTEPRSPISRHVSDDRD